MKLKIFAAAVAAAAFALPCRAMDLKGLGPDKTISEAKTAMPGLECYGSGCMCLRRCLQNLPDHRTLADVPVQAWMIDNDDDHIGMVSVTLSTEGFDQVVGALTEKYGPGKRETSSVKTRAGVEYDQVEVTWTQGDDVLTARKRSGKIDEMSLRLSSKHYLESKKLQAEERKKKGAKDL